jgi:hypothetical protein
MNTLYLPVSFEFHDSTNVTVTEAAVFIPEIWAQATLKNIFLKSAMIGAVSTDYSDEIAKQGDIVHVQKRGTLVSHEKVANRAVTLNVPTGSTVPVTLTNHKEVSFLIEDVAAAQSNTSLIDGYTADAGEVLATDVEDMLCGIYATGRFLPANDLDWDASDGASKLASMIALRSAMVVEGKLPESAPRYMVIRDMADFLNVDKFTSKEFLSQNSLQTGTVGEIMGFRVQESSQCVKTVSPTITHRLAFARDAIVLATRRLPDPPTGSGAKGQTVTSNGVGMRALMGYNMDYLGMQVSVDILFGAQIMYPQWVFELLDK